MGKRNGGEGEPEPCVSNERLQAAESASATLVNFWIDVQAADCDVHAFGNVYDKHVEEDSVVILGENNLDSLDAIKKAFLGIPLRFAM